MRQWIIVGGAALYLMGGRVATAADGVGLKPLSCGPYQPWQVACEIGSVGPQYRENDARIDIIRREGYASSKLHPHTTVLVAPGDDLQAKANLLVAPGDQLVLQDGNYANKTLTLSTSGTETAPIIIRPLTPGGVTFTGTTNLTLNGAHIILSDLKINAGSYPPGTTVVRLGGTTAPCNYCVAMDLEMKNLTLAAAAPATASLSYLEVRGLDATVAYSTFSGLSRLGHYIYASYPTELGHPQGPTSSRIHLFRNYFTNRTAETNENGYELLQLGWSQVQTQPMFGRVEENLFENSVVPNLDAELMTVKSSDWIIRNNTFRNTMGGVTLRSANRVLVEANYFFGGGLTSASGVRVLGHGHWIVGNYFEGNADPQPVGFPPDGSSNVGYYYSIAVSAGNIENTVDTRPGDGNVPPNNDGEPVAKNIVIANNTFMYGRRNIYLGAFYPYYPLMPRSIVVQNNAIRPAQPPSANPLMFPFVLPGADQLLYVTQNSISRNMISADPASSGLSGFVPDSANLFYGFDWAHDGFVYRPVPTSTTTNAATPMPGFPVVRAGAQQDIGAFQLRSPFRRPLVRGDAGYKAPINHTNLLTSTEAFDAAVWSKNRLRPFGGAGSQINVPPGPEASLTPELLREDDTAGTHSIEQVITANPNQLFTFSVYLKRAGRNAAMIYLASPQVPSSGIALRVDLGNGQAYQAYKLGDAQCGTEVAGFCTSYLVQNLGYEWYRVTLTGIPTSSAGTQVRAVVYMQPTASGSSSYTGDSTSGVYIWGAQLERDGVATTLAAN
jgi:hypothetical protein